MTSTHITTALPIPTTTTMLGQGATVAQYFPLSSSTTTTSSDPISTTIPISAITYNTALPIELSDQVHTTGLQYPQQKLHSTRFSISHPTTDQKHEVVVTVDDNTVGIVTYSPQHTPITSYQYYLPTKHSKDDNAEQNSKISQRQVFLPVISYRFNVKHTLPQEKAYNTSQNKDYWAFISKIHQQNSNSTSELSTATMVTAASTISILLIDNTFRLIQIELPLYIFFTQIYTSYDFYLKLQHDRVKALTKQYNDSNDRDDEWSYIHNDLNNNQFQALHSHNSADEESDNNYDDDDDGQFSHTTVNPLTEAPTITRIKANRLLNAQLVAGIQSSSDDEGSFNDGYNENSKNTLKRIKKSLKNTEKIVKLADKSLLLSFQPQKGYYLGDYSSITYVNITQLAYILNITNPTEVGGLSSISSKRVYKNKNMQSIVESGQNDDDINETLNPFYDALLLTSLNPHTFMLTTTYHDSLTMTRLLPLQTMLPQIVENPSKHMENRLNSTNLQVTPVSAVELEIESVTVLNLSYSPEMLEELRVKQKQSFRKSSKNEGQNNGGLFSSLTSWWTSSPNSSSTPLNTGDNKGNISQNILQNTLLYDPNVHHDRLRLYIPSQLDLSDAHPLQQVSYTQQMLERVKMLENMGKNSHNLSILCLNALEPSPQVVLVVLNNGEFIVIDSDQLYHNATLYFQELANPEKKEKDRKKPEKLQKNGQKSTKILKNVENEYKLDDNGFPLPIVDVNAQLYADDYQTSIIMRQPLSMYYSINTDDTSPFTIPHNTVDEYYKDYLGESNYNVHDNNDTLHKQSIEQYARFRTLHIIPQRFNNVIKSAQIAFCGSWIYFSTIYNNLHYLASNIQHDDIITVEVFEFTPNFYNLRGLNDVIKIADEGLHQNVLNTLYSLNFEDGKGIADVKIPQHPRKIDDNRDMRDKKILRMIETGEFDEQSEDSRILTSDIPRTFNIHHILNTDIPMVHKNDEKYEKMGENIDIDYNNDEKYQNIENKNYYNYTYYGTHHNPIAFTSLFSKSIPIADLPQIIQNNNQGTETINNVKRTKTTQFVYNEYIYNEFHANAKTLAISFTNNVKYSYFDDTTQNITRTLFLEWADMPYIFFSDEYQYHYNDKNGEKISKVPQNIENEEIKDDTPLNERLCFNKYHELRMLVGIYARLKQKYKDQRAQLVEYVSNLASFHFDFCAYLYKNSQKSFKFSENVEKMVKNIKNDENTNKAAYRWAHYLSLRAHNAEIFTILRDLSHKKYITALNIPILISHMRSMRFDSLNNAEYHSIFPQNGDKIAKFGEKTQIFNQGGYISDQVMPKSLESVTNMEYLLDPHGELAPYIDHAYKSSVIDLVKENRISTRTLKKLKKESKKMSKNTENIEKINNNDNLSNLDYTSGFYYTFCNYVGSTAPFHTTFSLSTTFICENNVEKSTQNNLSGKKTDDNENVKKVQKKLIGHEKYIVFPVHLLLSTYLSPARYEYTNINEKSLTQSDQSGPNLVKDSNNTISGGINYTLLQFTPAKFLEIPPQLPKKSKKMNVEKNNEKFEKSNKINIITHIKDLNSAQLIIPLLRLDPLCELYLNRALFSENIENSKMILKSTIFDDYSSDYSHILSQPQYSPHNRDIHYDLSTLRFHPYIPSQNTTLHRIIQRVQFSQNLFKLGLSVHNCGHNVPVISLNPYNSQPIPNSTLEKKSAPAIVSGRSGETAQDRQIRENFNMITMEMEKFGQNHAKPLKLALEKIISIVNSNELTENQRILKLNTLMLSIFLHKKRGASHISFPQLQTQKRFTNYQKDSEFLQEKYDIITDFDVLLTLLVLLPLFFTVSKQHSNILVLQTALSLNKMVKFVVNSITRSTITVDVDHNSSKINELNGEKVITNDSFDHIFIKYQNSHVVRRILAIHNDVTQILTVVSYVYITAVKFIENIDKNQKNDNSSQFFMNYDVLDNLLDHVSDNMYKKRQKYSNIDSSGDEIVQLNSLPNPKFEENVNKLSEIGIINQYTENIVDSILNLPQLSNNNMKNATFNVISSIFNQSFTQNTLNTSNSNISTINGKDNTQKSGKIKSVTFSIDEQNNDDLNFTIISKNIENLPISSQNIENTENIEKSSKIYNIQRILQQFFDPHNFTQTDITKPQKFSNIITSSIQNTIFPLNSTKCIYNFLLNPSFLPFLEEMSKKSEKSHQDNHFNLLRLISSPTLHENRHKNGEKGEICRNTKLLTEFSDICYYCYLKNTILVISTQNTQNLSSYVNIHPKIDNNNIFGDNSSNLCYCGVQTIPISHDTKISAKNQAQNSQNICTVSTMVYIDALNILSGQQMVKMEKNSLFDHNYYQNNEFSVINAEEERQLRRVKWLLSHSISISCEKMVKKSDFLSFLASIPPNFIHFFDNCENFDISITNNRILRTISSTYTAIRHLLSLNLQKQHQLHLQSTTTTTIAKPMKNSKKQVKTTFPEAILAELHQTNVVIAGLQNFLLQFILFLSNILQELYISPIDNTLKFNKNLDINEKPLFYRYHMVISAISSQILSIFDKSTNYLFSSVALTSTPTTHSQTQQTRTQKWLNSSLNFTLSDDYPKKIMNKGEQKSKKIDKSSLNIPNLAETYSILAQTITATYTALFQSHFYTHLLKIDNNNHQIPQHLVLKSLKILKNYENNSKYCENIVILAQSNAKCDPLWVIKRLYTQYYHHTSTFALFYTQNTSILRQFMTNNAYTNVKCDKTGDISNELLPSNSIIMSQADILLNSSQYTPFFVNFEVVMKKYATFMISSALIVYNNDKNAGNYELCNIIMDIYNYFNTPSEIHGDISGKIANDGDDDNEDNIFFIKIMNNTIYSALMELFNQEYATLSSLFVDYHIDLKSKKDTKFAEINKIQLKMINIYNILTSLHEIGYSLYLQAQSDKNNQELFKFDENNENTTEVLDNDAFAQNNAIQYIYTTIYAYLTIFTLVLHHHPYITFELHNHEHNNNTVLYTLLNDFITFGYNILHSIQCFMNILSSSGTFFNQNSLFFHSTVDITHIPSYFNTSGQFYTQHNEIIPKITKTIEFSVNMVKKYYQIFDLCKTTLSNIFLNQPLLQFIEKREKYIKLHENSQNIDTIPLIDEDQVNFYLYAREKINFKSILSLLLSLSSENRQKLTESPLFTIISALFPENVLNMVNITPELMISLSNLINLFSVPRNIDENNVIQSSYDQLPVFTLEETSVLIQKYLNYTLSHEKSLKRGHFSTKNDINTKKYAIFNILSLFKMNNVGFLLYSHYKNDNFNDLQHQNGGKDPIHYISYDSVTNSDEFKGFSAPLDIEKVLKMSGYSQFVKNQQELEQKMVPKSSILSSNTPKVAVSRDMFLKKTSESVKNTLNETFATFSPILKKKVENDENIEPLSIVHEKTFSIPKLKTSTLAKKLKNDNKIITSPLTLSSEEESDGKMKKLKNHTKSKKSFKMGETDSEESETETKPSKNLEKDLNAATSLFDLFKSVDARMSKNEKTSKKMKKRKSLYSYNSDSDENAAESDKKSPKITEKVLKLDDMNDDHDEFDSSAFEGELELDHFHQFGEIEGDFEGEFDSFGQYDDLEGELFGDLLAFGEGEDDENDFHFSLDDATFDKNNAKNTEKSTKVAENDDVKVVKSLQTSTNIKQCDDSDYSGDDSDAMTEHSHTDDDLAERMKQFKAQTSIVAQGNKFSFNFTANPPSSNTVKNETNAFDQPLSFDFTSGKNVTSSLNTTPPPVFTFNTTSIATKPTETTKLFGANSSSITSKPSFSFSTNSNTSNTTTTTFGPNLEAKSFSFGSNSSSNTPLTLSHSFSFGNNSSSNPIPIPAAPLFSFSPSNTTQITELDVKSDTKIAKIDENLNIEEIKCSVCGENDDFDHSTCKNQTENDIDHVDVCPDCEQNLEDYDHSHCDVPTKNNEKSDSKILTPASTPFTFSGFTAPKTEKNPISFESGAIKTDIVQKAEKATLSFNFAQKSDEIDENPPAISFNFIGNSGASTTAPLSTIQAPKFSFTGFGSSNITKSTENDQNVSKNPKNDKTLMDDKNTVCKHCNRNLQDFDHTHCTENNDNSLENDKQPLKVANSSQTPANFAVNTTSLPLAPSIGTSPQNTQKIERKALQFSFAAPTTPSATSSSSSLTHQPVLSFSFGAPAPSQLDSVQPQQSDEIMKILKNNENAVENIHKIVQGQPSINFATKKRRSSSSP